MQGMALSWWNLIVLPLRKFCPAMRLGAPMVRRYGAFFLDSYPGDSIKPRLHPPGCPGRRDHATAGSAEADDVRWRRACWYGFYRFCGCLSWPKVLWQCSYPSFIYHPVRSCQAADEPVGVVFSACSSAARASSSPWRAAGAQLPRSRPCVRASPHVRLWTG